MHGGDGHLSVAVSVHVCPPPFFWLSEGVINGTPSFYVSFIMHVIINSASGDNFERALNSSQMLVSFHALRVGPGNLNPSVSKIVFTITQAAKARKRPKIAYKIIDFPWVILLREPPEVSQIIPPARSAIISTGRPISRRRKFMTFLIP